MGNALGTVVLAAVVLGAPAQAGFQWKMTAQNQVTKESLTRSGVGALEMPLPGRMTCHLSPLRTNTVVEGGVEFAKLQVAILACEKDGRFVFSVSTPPCLKFSQKPIDRTEARLRGLFDDGFRGAVVSSVAVTNSAQNANWMLDVSCDR